MAKRPVKKKAPSKPVKPKAKRKMTKHADHSHADHSHAGHAEAATTDPLARRIGGNMPYIRWAISHMQEINKLIDYGTIIFDPASTFDQRVDALKAALDVVKVIWADFPGFDVSGVPRSVHASHEDVAALRNEGLVTDATLSMPDFTKLLDNLPMVLKLLQMLLPLLVD